MEEIWKPIPGHPNYEASSMGRVRSIDMTIVIKNRYGSLNTYKQPGRILSAGKAVNSGGYRGYHLGIKNSVMAHRVIASAFFGEIPKGMVVNHKNGVRTDNRIDNLEIVSQRDNILHARKIGNHKKTSNGKPFLSVEEVTAIRFFWVRGKRRCPENNALCVIFNRSHTTLYNLVNGGFYTHIR